MLYNVIYILCTRIHHNLLGMLHPHSQPKIQKHCSPSPLFWQQSHRRVSVAPIARLFLICHIQGAIRGQKNSNQINQHP